MGSFFSVASHEKESDLENKNAKQNARRPLNVSIVLLYSYVGTGYHGLQYNDGNHTIEEILFDTFEKSGLIPPKSYHNLNLLKWHEASRTDVGVHAAAQVLSCRVSLPEGFKIKDIPELLKMNSPKNSPLNFIKAIPTPFDRFDAQKFADGRRYQYLMPLHAFKDQTEEHLQYIRTQILPHFVGSKNYHNYTKRKFADSPSARRVIWKFDISEPFDINNEKYVLWTIHGQSFMMNQIRKMLATVLCVSYDLLSLENLDKTFTLERWALSILPGDGLFLDKVEYRGQKRKFANQPGKDVEFDAQRPIIEEWKNNKLFPSIAKLVAETDLFRKWINSVMKEFPPVPQTDEKAESEGKRRKKNAEDDHDNK